MPQTNYGFAPEARALPGWIGTSRDGEGIESKILAAPFEVYDLTVGGTATDGVYSFAVDGVTVAVTRAAGAPATNALLATALAAAGEAAGALDNVANFTNPSAGVVRVTAVQPLDQLQITAVTAPNPGTLTAALVTSAIATGIVPGTFVARVAGSENQCRLPTVGDTDATILGVALRSDWAMSLNFATEAETLVHEGGALIGVAYDGVDPWVLVDETGIAPGDTVHVRISGGLAGQIGMAGNDTAAGARVALTGCVFLTGVVALPSLLSYTNAQGIAKIRLNRPAA